MRENDSSPPPCILYKLKPSRFPCRMEIPQNAFYVTDKHKREREREKENKRNNNGHFHSHSDVLLN